MKNHKIISFGVNINILLDWRRLATRPKIKTETRG